MVLDHHNPNQILNFLDIDLNSYISHASAAQTSHNQQHQISINNNNNNNNISSNFLSSSNPNLVFSNGIDNNPSSNTTNFNDSTSTTVDNNNNFVNSSGNMQHEDFGDYSIFANNNVKYEGGNGLDISYSHQYAQNQHSNEFYQQQQQQQKPPGSKILPLLSNKSAPIRLTTSTSCSYLEFYQPSLGNGGSVNLLQHQINTPPLTNALPHTYHPKSHLSQSFASSINFLPLSRPQIGDSPPLVEHQQFIQSDNANSQHISQIDEYVNGKTEENAVLEFSHACESSSSSSTFDDHHNHEEAKNSLAHHQQADSLFHMEDFSLADTPSCPLDSEPEPAAAATAAVLQMNQIKIIELNSQSNNSSFEESKCQKVKAHEQVNLFSTTATSHSVDPINSLHLRVNNSIQSTATSPTNSISSPTASSSTTITTTPITTAKNSSSNTTLYSNANGGFLSRSNSQPDLTINLEKLLPNTSNYNSYFYNTSCVATSSAMTCISTNTNNVGGNFGGVSSLSSSSSAAAAEANFNNTHSATNHHYTLPMHMNCVMNGNLVNGKQLRRYPSLTIKTPSEMWNEPTDNEYFSSFNINDYMSGDNNVSNVTTGFNLECLTGSGGNTGSTGVFNAASTYSATTSGVSSSSSLTTTSLDDGLLVGIEAITDFLNKNSNNCTNLFEDLPDLEDLMSLVTFDSSSTNSSNTASSNASGIGGVMPVQRHVSVPTSALQETLVERNTSSSNNTSESIFASSNSSNDVECVSVDVDASLLIKNNNNQIDHNANSISNYYDYNDMDSLVAEENMIDAANISSGGDIMNGIQMNPNSERVSRSAPPSPNAAQKKKQRPTSNLAWNKMDEEEHSKTVEYMTRIVNEEMALREQLDFIRILNPDMTYKSTDTQFVIDLKMIDDEKFKRIKEIMKFYGFPLDLKQPIDNMSDLSPLAKRELRIKRAQHRLKLKQQKEKRQHLKENKSGLFSYTEVVPLKQALPEEDIDIDVLS